MIYFFENYDDFSAEKFLGFLPAYRREKFEKLKQKRDKENCVASYLLFKKALADFGVEDFEIEIKENGKPFLKNNKNIFFNISHTDGGVAVVADKRPVGIDIQDILTVREGVIERCFSADEKDIISKSNSPEREFTRLWTLKESAVKCNAETLAELKNYCFENSEKTFEKYDKTFTTFERKNLFVSVCGGREFSLIKEINSLEEFL
ncbi:MAG: 4'-phosphopantetheinyl transferase superfamily protein [Clostridia bacterium]|nr:4'-phosphopantetheinyl transferase superfamily protein [Clostridia bacterium]